MPKKEDIYDISRFTPEQLMKLNQSVQDYALAIGGLPKSYEEVFEKRGWLLPFLFAYDDLLWGRWNYWFKICQRKTIQESGPIPKIKWVSFHDPKAQRAYRMLQKCMDISSYDRRTIDHFADWLLWGFAAIENPPDIDLEVNRHFYKTFDLFLVLDAPTDYLSNLLYEETGKGYKSGLGYFPTPFEVSRLMAEMIVDTHNPEKMKKKTFYDPCVGCGSLMLPMSNYVLRGYAQDISSIAIKLCKIQMYWYAPWFAFHPDDISGFDKYDPPITIRRGNQLELVF